MLLLKPTLDAALMYQYQSRGATRSLVTIFGLAGDSIVPFVTFELSMIHNMNCINTYLRDC